MGSINLSLHHIESIRIIERRCDSTNEQYFTIRVDTDTDIHDIILFVCLREKADGCSREFRALIGP